MQYLLCYYVEEKYQDRLNEILHIQIWYNQANRQEEEEEEEGTIMMMIGKKKRL